MGKGYIVEDDRELVVRANGPLTKGVMPNFPLTEIIEIDLENANQADYWKSLGITGDDVVILDLNLQRATVGGVKVVGRTIAGGSRPGYSGFDVLKRLQESKRGGELPELERVLVATSIARTVRPRSVSPDLAFATGFDVYGMEKGVDATGKVDSRGYAQGLLATIARIYRGEIAPLNQGWRGD